MSSRIKALSIFGAAAIASMTVHGASQAARNAPASIARAQLPADHGCFGLNWSSLFNVCGSLKSIEAPLSIDSTGTKTVRISAYGNSPSENVGCRAVGTDADVWTYYVADATRWLSTFGGPATITTSQYVPAGGRLFVICDVYAGGKVHTFSWNQ